MKREIYVLIMLYLFVGMQTSAQTVTQSMALQVAENFFQYPSRSHSLSSIQIQSFGNTEQPTMYACSLSDAWVLVAGDQRAEPILAYSDRNGHAFPPMENISPTLLYLMEGYNEYIEALRNNHVDQPIHQQWNMYLEPLSRSIPNRSVIVSPLLVRNGHEVVWGQEGNNDNNEPDTAKVFNKFCPPKNNCDHAVVGCVAVAVGQIMWYWQWPYAKNYANFPEKNLICTYDWDIAPYQLINASPLEEANMVAYILHEIGVAVNMRYGCNSSGAFSDDVVQMLQNSFFFNVDNRKDRSDYADSTWFRLLREELNEQRPVYYGGATNRDSHAFVIDGYDSNNKFHVNFGDRGEYNGYYDLNHTYSIGQEMITGICPKYEFYCSPYTIPFYVPLPTDFTIRHGGGITIIGQIISNGMHGRIYSEEYIKLGPGTYINKGAKVYIRINGSRCNNDQMRMSVPRNLFNHPNSLPNNSTQTKLTTQKILRNGQLLIEREGKIYNATGIRVK